MSSPREPDKPMTAKRREELQRKVAPYSDIKIGYTLDTPQTRKWSAAQWESNQKEEYCRLFVGFHEEDQGRSRRLVAECPTAREASDIGGLVHALREALASDALRAEQVRRLREHILVHGGPELGCGQCVEVLRETS